MTVYFLKPFSGLCFDSYTFFPPPTAAAGAWSRDMEADIVECDKLEESEDTSQGSGPVPNRFLSSPFAYIFFSFFTAAVILLIFQAFKASVFDEKRCRCLMHSSTL